MKNVLSYLPLIVITIILTGCDRVFDWTICNFYQANTLDRYVHQARDYIRSITIYDQFTTVGMFNVLWLSDNLRTLYSKAYALKFGFDHQQHMAFLRRQLEENKHFISFYVLIPYDETLGQCASAWSILMEVDGTIYKPVEVKPIKLCPEYATLFGCLVTSFKTAYQIKFDARTIDDHYILDAGASCLLMHFRSVRKNAAVAWPLQPGATCDVPYWCADCSAICQEPSYEICYRG